MDVCMLNIIIVPSWSYGYIWLNTPFCLPYRFTVYGYLVLGETLHTKCTNQAEVVIRQ